MQDGESKNYDDIKMLQWRKRFNKFCTKSSIHGLAHLTSGHDEEDQQSSNCARVTWFIVIGTLLIILVLATGAISFEAFGRKKVYTSITITKNKTMTFPDIHICDSSFFSRRRLSGKPIHNSVLSIYNWLVTIEMGFNDTMGNYLIAAQATLLVADGLRQDKERNKQFSDALNQLLEPYGGDFRYVLTRAALR